LIAPNLSLVIEKVFPHPPEKLWRALTEKSLIALQMSFTADTGNRAAAHQGAAAAQPVQAGK